MELIAVGCSNEYTNQKTGRVIMCPESANHVIFNAQIRKNRK